MKNTKAAAAAAAAAAGIFAAKTAKEKLADFFSDENNRRKLENFGSCAVQKLAGRLAGRISDNSVPFFNHYDSSGFMEGSGYFLAQPAENARWTFGFAKASVVPDKLEGDYYIAGYLAFPPNRMNGIMNRQTVRAFALDDSSGRGINVFAVIDCIGISGTDIKAIRLLLKDLINEKNIVSINISATHCHSGIDTSGLWGSLPKAYAANKKALRKNTPEKLISGRNPKFMQNLREVCAETIKKAVLSMEPAHIYYCNIPIDGWVRDKRPPYVTVNYLTALKFVPDSGKKPLTAISMAAHATCYGDKQREASRDFPGYFCDAVEKAGFDAMFIQGAEAAVAADRGAHIPPGLTRDGGIKAYGEALAQYVLSYDSSKFTEIEPLLNVALSELYIKADNKILELAVKLRLVNNQLVRVTASDSCFPRKGRYDNMIVTEIGFAELGKNLKLAMIPGELMPELAVGGAFEGWASCTGEDWNYPYLKDIFGGELAVIGLCNDFIGYIVPDNDFGSIFTPLHYEEAVSAGGKTASNIISGFVRLKEYAEKIRINEPQTIKK